MLVGFGDPGERRRGLEEEVDAILRSASDGRVGKIRETQSIDFKEEAGRRNGAGIEPGSPQNGAAATKLADEVACMANTPGGGALIVGVEDKTGVIIGTELDIEWLRQRIYSGVDVAPDIVEKRVEGQRVLVIFVAPAREPVGDTSGRLRWRVGDSCVPVDRSQWWQFQREHQVLDEMAQPTGKTIADVRPGAIDILRRSLPQADELTTEEVMRHLGALGPDGRLSAAGALVFTAQPAPVVELTVFDVFGGDISNRVVSEPGTSVLEQLDLVERSLRVVNRNATLVKGFVHDPVPLVPHSAVREALLNALIHRDWNRSEPVDVRWIELDNTLIVRSPGGFPAEVTSENVLSNRSARYPALADLYRAVGLVDKQGVGVDRMYQSMITLGHRPPIIEEVAGPYVENTLVGGPPVVAVLDLVSRIVPKARQRDYRIAIILYLLMSRAFVTEEAVAHGLQAAQEQARNALEAAAQTTVDGEPLVEPYRQTWILGPSSRAVLAARLPYLGTDPATMEEVAMLWLTEVGDVATSDLVMLCDVSRGTAKKCVDTLLADGTIEAVGGGRSTRYRLA
ncbi:DUF5635 domain-containing protein [Corynebacterium liangguodongii]|uniref:DUF5635 domain-containing protein n=1 Tax=Corynebacterium liangguodongii TaxID=2079535 RepID=UPI001F2E8329|nr:DUF5635 domain-containing protein [Corynebacterium liangguodongii]